MAYTMTITPAQLTEALDAAGKREFDRSVDAMLNAVDMKLNETISDLVDSSMTSRTIAFTDDDYTKPVYDAVAQCLTDLGFKAIVRDDTSVMNDDDSYTLLITG